MLKKIKQKLGKLKILYKIIRAAIQKHRRPVYYSGEIIEWACNVKFIDSGPVEIIVCCLRCQYYYHDGRTYHPSGKYKDWIMYYLEPLQRATPRQLVRYPAAHTLKSHLEHYVAYLGTTARGGYA